MKKIKTITYLSALGLFGTCAAISTSSCKPNDINVKLLSLSSDGVADKTDSATLTLSITSLISDLVAKNITIKNNTEASRIIKADKILSESGQQYEFSIVGT
jgi:hypothetical protein